MASFKVGEIALLQNVVGPFSFLNGTECEITQSLAKRALLMRKTQGLVFGFVDVYMVRIVEGREVYASEIMLRKKQPPVEFTGETSIAELFKGAPQLNEMACAA
jgi:hypothetical protein